MPEIIKKLDDADEAIRKAIKDFPGMSYGKREALKEARGLIQRALTKLLGH